MYIYTYIYIYIYVYIYIYIILYRYIPYHVILHARAPQGKEPLKDSKSRKLVFDGIDAAAKCHLTEQEWTTMSEVNSPKGCTGHLL